MNPQGHKGKFFELQQAPQGMSSLRGLAEKHGNRRFDVVNLCFAAPFRYLLPFLLDKKGPKNQGRHQGPTAQSRRPSPMSARPPRPARSVFGVPTHGKLIFELFLSFAPSAASRHCEASFRENGRSNPDIQQAPQNMSSQPFCPCHPCGEGAWHGIYGQKGCRI